MLAKSAAFWMLVRLAEHIEKAMKLKSQIKSAMVYLSAIIGVAVIVMTILIIWVIPIFTKMFTEMSAGKVGPRYCATPSGCLIMDRLFLRLPIIGDLIRKASVAKSTRTLGTLTTAGVYGWFTDHG